MNFPESTYFNRKLPKQIFYENLTVPGKTKKLLVKQIKAIYWQNKLSESTVNIAAKNSVTEIEIFRVILNQEEIDESLLKILDMGIPYQIIFILEFNGKCKLCAAYKEVDSRGKCRIVSEYFYTDWDAQENIKLEISGLSLESAYNGFIRQIAKDKIIKNSEDIKADIEASKQKAKLKKEIDRVEKLARNEKQPKKKLALANEAKRLTKQLGELSKNA